jgi:hypothetical protein
MINVITKDTMLRLDLQELLRYMPTILQLADRSTINLEEVLEGVMVSLDSWEYPIYFIVLQSKSKLNGYLLILGIPWLATTNAYIICRVGNMTIIDGQSQNKLVLYPPTKPLIETKMHM